MIAKTYLAFIYYTKLYLPLSVGFMFALLVSHPSSGSTNKGLYPAVVVHCSYTERLSTPFVLCSWPKTLDNFSTSICLEIV